MNLRLVHFRQEYNISSDYNLNYKELEERIIFWILAAGKNGTRAAKITNDMVNFWEKDYPNITPFSALFHYDMEETKEFCKCFKTGCHSHKARSLYQICRADIDLKTCSAEDLEKEIYKEVTKNIEDNN